MTDTRTTIGSTSLGRNNAEAEPDWELTNGHGDFAEWAAPAMTLVGPQTVTAETLPESWREFFDVADGQAVVQVMHGRTTAEDGTWPVYALVARVAA